MGILWPIVHIPIFANFVNEEPEGNGSENALPHGLGNVVPHLGVDSMQLLHAAHVTLGCRCEGEGPHAQVVHVLQCCVIVFEWDLLSWLKPDRVVDVLAVVVRWLEAVHDSLGTRLEVAELLVRHCAYFLYLLKYYNKVNNLYN